jgi:hypothetical protein
MNILEQDWAGIQFGEWVVCESGEVLKRNKDGRTLIDLLALANREIEVLRLYGNKDCTAMADEKLKEELK